MVFPPVHAPDAATAYSRNVNFKQQTCVLKPVDTAGRCEHKLVLAIIAGGDDVFVLGSKTLRDRLTSTSYKTCALVCWRSERRLKMMRSISTRENQVNERVCRAPVIVQAMQQIAVMEHDTDEKDESPKEVHLATGPAMVLQEEAERL